MTDLSGTPPSALTPMVGDDEMQRTLLTAIGFEKLSAPQRELALAIARQYGLDPMLRHLVIVEGKPYITRDGLLHVAHKSNVFDGIEVDQPALDEDGKYWRTWATVYRKDMKRPFRYPGRYPATGGNVKYNEEMCIKVAEVMTLRRAFDVAAPVLEERWDGEIDDVPEAPSATVTDRIAQRAAQIEAKLQEDDPGGPAAVGIGQALAEMEEAGDIVVGYAFEPEETPSVAPDPEEATEVPPQIPVASETPPDVAALIADQPTASEGPSLNEFADLTSALERSLVQATAKRLFPDKKGFKELTPAELGQVLDALAETDEGEDGIAAAVDDISGMATAPVVSEAIDRGEESFTDPPKVELCGAVSPYDGVQTCTLDKGHTGPAHRAGLRVSW